MTRKRRKASLPLVAVCVVIAMAALAFSTTRRFPTRPRDHSASPPTVHGAGGVDPPLVAEAGGRRELIDRSLIHGDTTAELARVSVLVRDEDRSPIGGVVISRGAHGGYAVREEEMLGATDARGMAVIAIEAMEGLGDPVTVSAWGFVPERVLLEPGRIHEVTLRRGMSMTLRVTDTAGRPVAGVPLICSTSVLGGFHYEEGAIAPCYSSSGPLLLQAESDSQGILTFTGLREGVCRVRSADPRFPLTSEASRRLGRLDVAEVAGSAQPVAVVVDQPLIAFWIYSDDVIDCGFELSFKGHRHLDVERSLAAKEAGSRVVAIEGRNHPMAALSVEAVLASGSIMKHEVPFLPLVDDSQPIVVTPEAGHVSPAATVRFALQGAWCEESLLRLICTRKEDGSSRGSLRRFPIRDGRAAVPLGGYLVSSEVDMLAEKVEFDVENLGGSPVVSLRCRSDRVLAKITAVSASGRRVSVPAMVSGRGLRRGCVLNSLQPTVLFLAAGEYRIDTVAGFERTIEHAVSIPADWLGTERELRIEIDDR